MRPRKTPSWEAARTDLELAAGPAVRVDAVADDGYAFASYSISDGPHWWELRCSASTPPRDRWLSIAETFEFLPEER